MKSPWSRHNPFASVHPFANYDTPRELAVALAGAWELMTAAMIDAERNSLRIDKHRHRPADDRRDILDGDEQLHEVMRAWGSRPDAALNSFSATTVDAAIVHRIVRVNRPIEDLPINAIGQGSS